MGSAEEIERCVFLEIYFEARGFRSVRSFRGADIVLLMERDRVGYRIHIERKWVDSVPVDNIDLRLEKLSTTAFLLNHIAAKISLTASGQDAIMQLSGHGYPLPRSVPVAG